LKNLSKAAQEGYWSEEEVEERKMAALKDMQSGAYLRWDIHVGLGFKQG
jgi:hypothetical protein